MTLRNRLKKLESEIIGDSTVCVCNGQEQQIEMRHIHTPYDAYSTGKYVPYQDSEIAKELDRELETETLTIENCQRCGKPINKHVIILNLVGSKKLTNERLNNVEG